MKEERREGGREGGRREGERIKFVSDFFFFL